MPRRKPAPAATPLFAVDPSFVLVGDVRSAPIQVHQEGRTFNPDIALWLDARDGRIVGHSMTEPGRPAQTLVQCLLQAVGSTGTSRRPSLPARLVVLDPRLADQIRLDLAHFSVQVEVTPRHAALDAAFAELFTHLKQIETEPTRVDLPDGVLKRLVAAAERLWKAKPWAYTYENWPFAIVPRGAENQAHFASLMGREEILPGMIVYTSLEDFQNVVAFAASPSDDEPESVERTEELLKIVKHKAYLVTFAPKDEIAPSYRDQLARCGWSRRLSVVPNLMAVGGVEVSRDVTADEAIDVTMVIDALVEYCKRHRTTLTNLETPPREAVEIGSADQPRVVDVSYAMDEKPAELLRFRVSLVGYKDVWRLIDVPRNETLEDLHYAIQEAFGWDDDHLYSFFLSGKAWDKSTEYVTPEARQPGEGSAEIRLDRLNLHPRQRILYIFDYGDEWRHDIRVEKVGLKPDGGEYPRVVEQHGTPPPQYPLWDEDDEDEDDEGEDEDGEA